MFTENEFVSNMRSFEKMGNVIEASGIDRS